MPENLENPGPIDETALLYRCETMDVAPGA